MYHFKVGWGIAVSPPLAPHANMLCPYSGGLLMTQPSRHVMFIPIHSGMSIALTLGLLPILTCLHALFPAPLQALQSPCQPWWQRSPRAFSLEAQFISIYPFIHSLQELAPSRSLSQTSDSCPFSGNHPKAYCRPTLLPPKPFLCASHSAPSQLSLILSWAWHTL